MAAAVPTSRLRPSHRPVKTDATYISPARKSLLASIGPIFPCPHYTPGGCPRHASKEAISADVGAQGRSHRPLPGQVLFLARLHQSSVEQDRVELGVIVLPALVRLLGVAGTNDEAGLLRLSLEFRILQRSDDVRFEEAQPIFRDAFWAGNAPPCTDDDIKTLLAKGRNVGCHEVPRSRGDAENLQLTRFMLLDGVGY